MSRLPPHHVPRPRLTDLCGQHQVVVIEAAGGYGKSVLAAELVDHWQSVGVEVRLDHAGMSAPLLAARLHEAVSRAGFTDAAASAENKVEPAMVVDTVVSGLAGEPCTFVIDDAHNAGRDAGRLIDHLATRLESGHRLIVLVRQLPDGASRLRRAEYLQLTASDLALSFEETLSLCRQGFGLDVGDGAARALDRATDGWTAAAVLAAARASRTGEPVEAVAGAATGPGHPAGALAAILDEALVTLGPDCRPLLAQIARLPLLDSELVGAVSGDAGLFERSFSAGIPFTPARARWWDLPGPVRDHLALLAPASPEAMRTAAHEYTLRDELGAALELLLATGDAPGAAALLASTPPGAEDTLDTLELGALFDQLPREAIASHPDVLLLVARRFGHAGRYAQCCEYLEQARSIARDAGDALLERAAAAELIKVELLADIQYEAAERATREILREAEPDEKLTRARTSEFLGYALCRQVDEHGQRPEAALVEAEDCFARAARLYRDLGMRSAAAFIAVDWSSLIEFPLGHAAAAIERIEEALLLVADLPRAWAFVMLWRASYAAELGQDELCRRSVDEVLRVAEQKKSSFLVAQAHRRLATLASYRGDAEATLEHVRQVELHGKVWWELGSGEFLAEAADLLDRVGHTALALEYLARGVAEPKDAGHLIALAEAVLEARHGDPAAAGRRLLGLGPERIDPRERWRVTLLTGYAAFRGGDHALAATLAAQGFEEAARLGQPELPLIRERAVTEQLLGLAANTGHPAALALRASALPISLAVLGRFEMTVAGRPMPLGSGQEIQLLKFITVSGGRVHTDQAIETLWPEVSASAGRHRLRTVLNRLRAAAGDVVLREGEALALDPVVRVDAQEFLTEARAAIALAAKDPAMAAALARGAMSRYQGELLPDDRYDDWAEAPRRQAQQVMLDLLDLCAAEDARRGDLDALRRTVERTIEFAPYDDVRYLRAASALLDQGRRGEALAIVHRARAAFAQIGLDPPDPLLELERTLAA